MSDLVGLKDAADVLGAGLPLDAFAAPVPARGRNDVDDDRPTPVPTFPVDVLPPAIGNMVGAVAESTQTPADLAASLALSVIATGVQRSVVLHVRGDYHEPLALWTAAILPPSERKTAVLSAMLAPLRTAEAAWMREAEPARARDLARRRVLEKRLAAAEKEAATAKGAKRDQARNDVDALAAELEACKVAALPRLLGDDATPEAASALLAEHGRIGFFSDEGGIFALVGGRYSNGVPNLDVFLKAWSGTNHRVDRRGGASILATRPHASHGLVVQPDVIAKLREVPGFRERGYIARWLFFVPTSLVGKRKGLLDARSVPGDVANDYRTAIDRVLEAHRTTERVLELDDAARLALHRWGAELEPRCGRGGDLEPIADWVGKLQGQTARIAALLHLAGEDADGAVAVGSMDSAIRVARDYLLPHAERAFALMSDGGAGRQIVDKVLAALVAANATGCTRTDLHAATHRNYSKQQLDAALDDLAARGLAHREGRRVTGGAPADVWRAGPGPSARVVHQEAPRSGASTC